MKKIRILIADDHQLFIDGMTSLIHLSDNMEVCAQASSGKQVLELLEQHDIDVALLDISMPDMDGIEVAEHIYSFFPNVKVIGLSMHNQVPYVVNMLKAGAKGYLLKHIGRADLFTAIETINNGGVYYSPEVAIHLVTKLFKSGVNEVMQINDLSSREKEVVKLIVKGEPNKIIANQLSISEATVKTHRQRILTKLKLKNTPELIKYAYEHNIS